MVKKQQRRGFVMRIESIFIHQGDHKNSIENEPSVSPDGEHREKRELLHAAINRLPENQRIAFVLCKYEENSYKQIAEIMKISLPAVESLIHRARLNLQKHLVYHFSEYQKT